MANKCELCEILLEMHLPTVATIEARGEMPALRDASEKVKVVFCADATPTSAFFATLL